LAKNLLNSLSDKNPPVTFSPHRTKKLFAFLKKVLDRRGWNVLYYSAKKYIYTLRYILLLYNIGVLLSRAFFYFCRIAAELLIFHSFFHQFAQQQKTHPPPCILRPKIFSDSDWYTVYIFPKSWYTDKSLFHKAKQRQRCVQRCAKPKSEVK